MPARGDYHLRKEINTKMQSYVDGKGAGRIARLLFT